jgi:hypothetical protein
MPDHDELPCPACGFLTIEGAYGSYVICDICGWEDDQVQLANPACAGGANSESLIEAQATALSQHSIGAEVADGVRRDPRWRPLSASERQVAEAEREEKYWKNRGIVSLNECYWLKPNSTRDAG